MINPDKCIDLVKQLFDIIKFKVNIDLIIYNQILRNAQLHISYVHDCFSLLFIVHNMIIVRIKV